MTCEKLRDIAITVVFGVIVYSGLVAMVVHITGQIFFSLRSLGGLQTLLKRMVLRLRLLISTMAVLLTPIGLAMAPMSISVMAQQSQLPPCDLKSVSWDNCQGSRQYTNGVYVGEFRSGQPNGQGTLTSSNGEKLVGEFKDGKLKETLPNGGLEYFLEFKDGKLKATLPNGVEFVFNDYPAELNGQLTWRGQLTWPNGEKYVGEFKDASPYGQGTLTYPDGSKYVGEVRDGQPNGQGTITYSNGSKYVGEFRDDKLEGQGTFTYADGSKYVGEVRDGQPNGQGTATYPDGSKCVGEFRNGGLNGQGTATHPDGSKYVGEFKDNKFDGQGTSYAPGALTGQWGIWADGKFVGTVPSQELVAMENEGGVYVVPVRFNEAITLSAIVDSGSSDVSVPADIVSTLIRTKTLTEQDFLGERTYVLADGTEVPSPRFRIRSLRVGNTTLENVTASVASSNALILLGQSFLGRFKSWSVDNDRHVLILR